MNRSGRWRGGRVAWGAALLALGTGHAAAAPAAGEATAGAVPETVLFKALGDELARTMERLRIDDAEAPYFVSYRVTEVAGVSANASMGASAGHNRFRGRRLATEVRVGSHQLDNTNFFSNQLFRFAAPRERALPLSDDYENLRRHIWLATDAAYKQALSLLASKKAALQNKKQLEEVADFSEEEPFRIIGARPPAVADAARAIGLARELSALFRDEPSVFLSNVRVEAVDATITYLNSEGSAFVRHEPLISVTVTANTQSEDGTELHDAATADARSWKALPAVDHLAAQVRTLIENLAVRRAAPRAERYTGPVLFEGQAVAELVAQVLAPRLLAVRLPVPDNPMFEPMLEQLRNPFMDKLGARVLDRSLSVTDDPTAVDENGAPLLGSYPVDDEAVPARPTPIIENGILKTLLTTRAPAPDLPNSTGNSRGGANATLTPSNLIITAKDGLSSEDLRAELMALVEERGLPHGLIVRRVEAARGGADAMRYMMAQAGQGTRVRPLALAYKVFADGREEVVGRATLPTFDEAQFKDIVAASATGTRHVTRVAAASPLAGFPGAAGPLSTIDTPALLFEDVTVRAPTGNVPKPPVAPHPLAASR